MNQFISRNIVFPAIFAMRNERVFRALRTLEETQWLSSEQMRALQFKKLKSILAHAHSSIPFYRSLFDKRRLKPDDIKSLDDLQLLPPLEKKNLRELAATLQLPSFKRLSYSVIRTSGTSGIPVSLYIDRDSHAQSLAARYRVYRWFGIAMGDREAKFGGRSLSFYEKNSEKVKDTLLNRLRIEQAEMNIEKIELTLNKFFRFAPDYIHGYPSLISRFSEYFRTVHPNVAKARLKAAVCTSEMSMKYEREKVSRILGCPAVDEYGCSETDIIAFECPNGSRHIMAENVFVETLPCDGLQDGAGELLVTDLNNRLMPLIRYRLGDIGTLGKGQCDCGRGLPILDKISGRTQKQYILTTNGDLIHTVMFAYFFESLSGRGILVRRYRIVQENIKQVRILIALDNDNPKARFGLEQHLRSEIGPILKGRIEYQIQYVEEIDTPQPNQKFSFFESRLDDR